MKRIFILSAIITFFTIQSKSQITKGNWMVGGNASFFSNYVTVFDATRKNIDIKIAPKIGYFIIDKFATGLMTDISYLKERNHTLSGTTAKVTSYVFGPFARYYFLKPDNQVNLFVQGNYAYGIVRGNDNVTTVVSLFQEYTFLAGPVIYFNSFVGLEFSVGYYHNNQIKANAFSNGIQMGIGLQIHLEKEN